jgi:uncharacterized membrane protein
MLATTCAHPADLPRRTPNPGCRRSLTNASFLGVAPRSDHAKSVVVDRPLTVVYNQWTQFEDFPHFMEGVESVTQLDDKRLHWVAEIAGTRREWDAEIVDQDPDQKISGSCD